MALPLDMPNTRGSADTLNIAFAQVNPTVGNVTARVGADEIVINGQSSAWVSNGSVAQVALAYMAADYGDGFHGTDEHGAFTNGIGLILPLTCPSNRGGVRIDRGCSRIRC